MKKIQTGDNVIVIAGKHKWAKSVVVASRGDKVMLKGVNMVKKAVKKQWFVEKEAPMHVSNVALYDSKTEGASKVGMKVADGKKTRVYKKSNAAVQKA